MNYLALADRLLERLGELRQRWPALAILGARDLAGVRAAEQRLPAVHVLYLGDRLGGEAGRGALLWVDQLWGAILVVRDLRDAAAAMAAGGELITAVLELLQGWQPSPAKDFGPLQRVAAPAPLYDPGGIVYLPLYFTCRVLSRGATD